MARCAAHRRRPQEGGRQRVHVVSDGYDFAWNVRFLRAVRESGARCVVDALHPAADGSHCVDGDMRRLV
ncbi:hypothetical protein [Streptomyces bungoensis]|uniref:hypothetical protein n=1 Tax=Streptomyces bungoensis TaxID=285568 RepID=UPI003F56F907